jgi:predicted N-acetyltransferase YhbS
MLGDITLFEIPIYSMDEVATELGYGLSLLVGHPEYYPRFGYERASKYSRTQPFPAPDECAIVKFLADAGREIQGETVFPKEFYLSFIY